MSSARDRDRLICNHGFDSTATPEVFTKFGRAATKRYDDMFDKCMAEQINPFYAVVEEAFLNEHREIFEDAAKMELMASIFAAMATTITK